MKTAVQQALDYALIIAEHGATDEEVREFFSVLLSSEKEEIELAWIDGNERGWKMETDWPQHATEYFNNRFKQQ